MGCLVGLRVGEFVGDRDGDDVVVGLSLVEGAKEGTSDGCVEIEGAVVL